VSKLRRHRFATRSILSAGLALSSLSAARALAQESDPVSATVVAEDPVHDQLRGLLRGLSSAIDQWKLDELTTYLHPDVVVTWPDATVSKGPAAVKEYLLGKTSGPNKVVETFKTTIEVDELTKLYADGSIGFAYGSSLDTFGLVGGRSMEVKERWSATLVKVPGDQGPRWLVASIHTSADLYDNPILEATKKLGVVASVVAGFVGLLLGILVTWWLRRGKTAR
jgi:hypothetical protein